MPTFNRWTTTPAHKHRMDCRRDLSYGAVLVQKNGANAPPFNTTSACQPAFMGGEMIHGRYRKALTMLSDNAYRHHDAQQRQPATVRCITI